MQQVNFIRSTLLETISRGRPIPPTIQTRTSPISRPTHPAFDQTLHVEELEYKSDSSPQGWVPLRIVKKIPQSESPTHSQRLPAIIMLHPTGQSKDYLASWQAACSRRGYITAAIDTRYHGDRVDPNLPYQEAIVRAWKDRLEKPFLLDPGWDLMRLVDLLSQREDVDPQKIGVTGYSLGGMLSWLLTVADDRIAVGAPIAGVQSFRYALENDQYHARVESIPYIFQYAAKEMKKESIDAEVVAAVWQIILPGLLDMYDAPLSVPAIAPRPFLIVTGEVDPRCPLPGVARAVAVAEEAYAAAGAAGNLELYVQQGVGHELTQEMIDRVDSFMDVYLMGT